MKRIGPSRGIPQWARGHVSLDQLRQSPEERIAAAQAYIEQQIARSMGIPPAQLAPVPLCPAHGGAMARDEARKLYGCPVLTCGYHLTDESRRREPDLAAQWSSWYATAPRNDQPWSRADADVAGDFRQAIHQIEQGDYLVSNRQRPSPGEQLDEFTGAMSEAEHRRIRREMGLDAPPAYDEDEDAEFFHEPPPITDEPGLWTNREHP